VHILKQKKRKTGRRKIIGICAVIRSVGCVHDRLTLIFRRQRNALLSAEFVSFYK
jgi:hypothetical protein